MQNGDFRHLTVSISNTTADILAAVTGRRIRLIAAFLQVDNANTTVTLLSASTSLGAAIVATGDGFVLPANRYGWVQTASGEALRLTASGGNVKGFVVVQVLAAGDS